MLIPWASQQQGGAPAPIPELIALSDFENSDYQIGGVPKAITDLWDLTNIRLLVETPGVGMVAECAPGTTSGSGTIVGTHDLFAAVNPPVGHTGVISVEMNNVSPNGNSAALHMIFADVLFGNGYSAYYESDSLAAPENSISLLEKNGAVQTFVAVGLGTPPRDVAYKYAYTIMPGFMAISVNGANCVTGVPPDDLFALLTLLHFYEGTYSDQASVTFRSVAFYSPVTNHAALKTLST